MQSETRSVFEAGQDSCLLEGLSLVKFSTRCILHEESSNKSTEQMGGMDGDSSVQMIPDISNRMCCSTCHCVFENREEQIEHYKLDWHRFNLKQRHSGRITVSMQEFEDKTCTGDVSSISGSDWEDSSDSEMDQFPAQTSNGDLAGGSTCKEEHRMGGHPQRILFQNADGQFLSVHRCVLSMQKGAEMDLSELVESLKKLHVDSCWVILMAGGGHFAGAVFKGNEVVKHKTFHRYTIRAKRGTSQGLHDNQNCGSMPRSAGASLRRYNEAALVKDIQALLESWAQDLQEARTIFLRAPSHNRALFYGRKSSLLQRNDPRVQNIPIATRRATFKEVKRVHATLAALHVYGKDTDIIDTSSPKKVWKKVKSVLKEPYRKDACEYPGNSEEEEELGPAEELVMEEESLETLQLREFEVFPRRNRKKKKRKEGRKLSQEPPGCPGTSQTRFLHSSAAAAAPVKEALKTLGCQEQKGHNHLGVSTGDVFSYQLRNDLYTFCKTGNTISLQRLLQPLLRAPSTEERPSTPVESLHSAGNMLGTEPLESAHAPSILTEQQENQRLEEPEEPNICSLSEQLEGERSDELDALALGALRNERVDGAGFTLLHVAAAMGQSTIMKILMDAGWDPAVRDDAGQTPYSVSVDRRTRNVFRKYQGDNPGKFDYSAAQIPGPLTAEIEAKKLEKRRVLKAHRREREKAERERLKQEAEEAAEKNRFAALSDREKRALAAERRFTEQLSGKRTPLSNTRRCWMCGESLLGKVPFDYLDFSFCSTACLQQHRRSKAAKP